MSARNVVVVFIFFFLPISYLDFPPTQPHNSSRGRKNKQNMKQLISPFIQYSVNNKYQIENNGAADGKNISCHPLILYIPIIGNFQPTIQSRNSQTFRNLKKKIKKCRKSFDWFTCRSCWIKIGIKLAWMRENYYAISWLRDYVIHLPAWCLLPGSAIWPHWHLANGKRRGNK